jgi:hypothetical protein
VHLTAVAVPLITVAPIVTDGSTAFGCTDLRTYRVAAISAGDPVTKQIKHFFTSAAYFVQFQLASDGFKERLGNYARIHIVDYLVAVVVNTGILFVF